MKGPCEYCGAALPPGENKNERRQRSAHFQQHANERPRYTGRLVDFLAQAAVAELVVRTTWQKLLGEGYVEEHPGHLVKRDEQGNILSEVTT